MRRLLCPLLCGFSALLLFACGGSNLDMLNGKWEVDGDAAVKAMGIGNPLKDSTAEDLFKEVLNGISLEIDAEKKTIVYAMGVLRLGGTFTVLSDKGTTIVIDESHIGKMYFEHIGNDSFVMYLEEERDQKFVFKRAIP